MKKGREKGGGEEEKKKTKHTLKYLYEAYMTAKKSTKQGRIVEGGGIFWLARIYTPCKASLNQKKSKVFSLSFYAF